MKVISSWTDMGIVERSRKRAEEISEIKNKFFQEKLVKPEDNIKELSDVAWQEDRSSKGNPIGYILVNNPGDSKSREFIFAYSKFGLEIARRKGFRNLTAFPVTNKIYVSRGTMFPTFLTKLPQKAREDLRGSENNNETDLLIKFSGVITDDFILVPPNYFGRTRDEKSHETILTNLGSINTTNSFGVSKISGLSRCVESYDNEKSK